MEQPNHAEDGPLVPTATPTRSLALVKNDCADAVLCGLVLAGGEGARPKPFVQRLGGDSPPKQYVRFTGIRSPLEHTFHRAERLISRERLFTVICQSHLDYAVVVDQLAGRHPGTVVAQPEDRDTGADMLLPLMYIQKRYPNAVVALFPSDQFARPEEHLMRHVRLAYVIVKQQPSKLVMLGVKPAYAEPAYGYILPSTRGLSDGWGTHPVEAFIEKPDSSRARHLIERGALWNTMLMVFHAGTLLRWMAELRPEVFHHFKKVRAAIGTSRERMVLRETYRQLEPINFSRDFLQPLARRRFGSVDVLPVSGVVWSDWDSERRPVEVPPRPSREAASSAGGPWEKTPVVESATKPRP